MAEQNFKTSAKFINMLAEAFCVLHGSKWTSIFCKVQLFFCFEVILNMASSVSCWVVNGMLLLKYPLGIWVVWVFFSLCQKKSLFTVLGNGISCHAFPVFFWNQTNKRVFGANGESATFSFLFQNKQHCSFFLQPKANVLLFVC